MANNGLKVLVSKKTIEMTKAFAKAATDPRSDEYALLQQVRRDYPRFKVTQRTINKKKSQEHYAGLTYEYMEDYIKTHGSKDECAKNLAEFKEQKLISLCHSTSRRYPTIKKWFLAKYPEVMEFGMPDAAEGNSSAEGNEVPYEMPVKISA